MFKFSVRELLLLTVAVTLGIGWITDRSNSHALPVSTWTIREVVYLVLLIGLGISWLIDRRRLVGRMNSKVSCLVQVSPGVWTDNPQDIAFAKESSPKP